MCTETEKKRNGQLTDELVVFGGIPGCCDLVALKEA
jgi:hypothetical protein